MLGRSRSLVIIASLFLITAVLLLSFPSITAFVSFADSADDTSADRLSYGPTWQQSCSGNRCTVSLYPYQRFYLADSHWHQIDESFGTIGCLPGYDFCVDQNLYQLYAKANLGPDAVTLRWHEATLSLTPKELAYRTGTERHSVLPLSGEGSITRNILSYTVGPGVSLEYTYYPDHLTQNLVFESAQSFPLPDRSLRTPATEVDLILTVSGDSSAFPIPTPVLYERHGTFIEPISSRFEGDQLILSFPLSLIYDASTSRFRTSFPLVIDPSFTLNDSNIRWNGYIQKSASNYTRFSQPTQLFVGRETTIPIKTYRSSIEFNTTPIPDTARIDAAQLVLYVVQAGNNYPTIQVYHMEGANISYPDTNQSNSFFFADMANGTLYGQEDVSTAPAQLVVEFDLTSQSRLDFQNALPSDLFSLGLFNVNESAQSAVTTFSAKDYASPDVRPILNITYVLIANESEGRAAIERGINASLPNNPIQTGQQVYLVNQNNEQFLGRFDKVTQSANQTWVFNYITSGENLTSMPSLFMILNVWENSSLSTAEITSQVSTFINQTKV